MAETAAKQHTAGRSWAAKGQAKEKGPRTSGVMKNKTGSADNFCFEK